MKNKIFYLLLFVAISITLKAQRPQALQINNISQEQINEMFFKKIMRTTTMLPSTPVLRSPSCNYIQNNNFNTTVTPYSQTDPFGLDQVNGWSSSHGRPTLADPFFGIQNPSTASNYALMKFGNSGGANPVNFSEGIVSKIAPLQVGGLYVFKFYELYPNYSFNSIPPFEQVDIYLIKCSDYSNFQVNSFQLPAVPTNSQRIFCETNLQAQPLIPLPQNWQNRVVNFQANDNYDMIWVRPVPKVNGTYPSLTNYAFALPELIDASLKIIMTPAVQSPAICNYTLQSNNCLLDNSQYLWTGPNGQTLIGNLINVDVSNAQNVGTWNVELQINNVNTSNNTCSNSSFPLITGTVLHSCSTTTTPPCINLPLIQ